MVAQSKVGNIIADDVINARGTILVAKNSVLTHYMIEKLMFLGIPYVWIYPAEELKPKESSINKNQESLNNYTEVVLTIKQILIELSSGGKLNYQKINHLSELVYVRVS